MAKEAIETGKITTPSGRQFVFLMYKEEFGSVSNFTQIKNYPVQSFATADIVPLVLTHIEDKIKRIEVLYCKYCT